MKHQRHYEPFKFDVPYKEFVFGDKYFEYGLKVTQDGKEEIASMWCYHYRTMEEAQAKADELNKTFYLSDWDQAEIEEFYKAIDFTPLYKKAEELVGMELHFNNILNDIRKSCCRSEGFLIESVENLVNYFPMLRAAWREMHVKTFSSFINAIGDDGELEISGSLNYDYVHQRYGRNGAEILSFSYSVSKGWNIMTATD